MFTTDQSRTRTIENQLAEQLKQTWLMLFLGVTTGFVGMHFLVARPAANELAKVKASLGTVEIRMQELSGATENVWETNSLLASLRAQQGQVADARVALQSIRALRSDLVDVASSHDQVTKALVSVDKLQSRMIEQQTKTDNAGRIFELMQSLENEIINQQESHSTAITSLDHLIALKDVAGAQLHDIDQAET